MAGFGDLVDDLDDQVMASLSDELVDYLSREGGVLAPKVPVIVDHGVARQDRLEVLSLVRTVCVQKRLLQPYDRKGAFRMADGVWQIDGIHSDDGSLITFYVVP
ncbi:MULTISPECIES: hypothetical protein [unclassified Pseudomonas]|uniref:hypothetical protein n=1 Tax=unclassified Pseudomonas TaxID=196821 RepID=UPI002449CFB9|nr:MULTISPECIES: hypothetical protein [unclassified Pseudomonas]MDG9926120.1 hypothetical protein [Pseudomonas sp. GD04045]MDH0037464.1 hypothetical protein [Pseudomonas sp. GD04019]